MDVRTESHGQHAGFTFCVLIMPMGHRCGYVLIPSGHPWHDKSIYDIDAEVHGGLTFGEHIDETHVNAARWPAHGYWIGFDCAHYFDAPDFDEMSPEYLSQYKTLVAIGRRIGESFAQAMGFELEDWEKLPEPEKKLRRRVYVEGQCKQLAAQAALAAAKCSGVIPR